MHFLQISCQCSAVAAVLSEQWNWEAGDEGWRHLVSSGAREKRAESADSPSCGANPRKLCQEVKPDILGCK